MGMTARGKKRLTLLTGVCVVGAAGLGGAVVLREQVRTRLMRQALEDGREAYAAGDYVRAMDRIGYYVSRADDDPDTFDIEALYQLADARRREPMARGQHLVRAAGLARRAADLSPDDPRPLRMLLEIYPALGFGNETLETAGRLLQIEPGDETAMLLRAQVLASVGRRAEAMAAAQELLESHPGSDRARMLVVQLMLLDGAPVDDVVAFVEGQASARPEDLGAQLLAADWQSRAGRGADAAATLLAARDLPIASASHLEWMVQLLDRVRVGEAGAGREASSVADSLLTERMSDPEVGQAAARIAAERLWRRGDEAGALAALGALVANPADAEVRTLGLACVVAIEAGQDDHAIAPLGDALAARSGDDARHWRALIDGRLALARGDFREAAARLDEASQLGVEPRLDLIAYWKSRALLLQGQQADALDAMEDATRLSPTWHIARASIINHLVDIGRVDDALSQAEAFYAFAPNAQPSAELGLALSRLFCAAVEVGGVGQITVEQGVANLASNAERVSGSGDLASLYARALASAGQTEEAEAVVARIIDDNLPISAPLLRDLYNSAARHGLAAASRVGALAAAAHPDSPELLFVRAQEAARAGRVDEGRTMFRDALARADEGSRFALERAFARFLVVANDPDGMATMRQLAESHPEAAVAQIDLLETPQAWVDEATIAGALDRLDAATGGGTAFRIYDARRLLTFMPPDPTERERALATAFERLGPLLRREPPVTPALLLGAEAELLEGDTDSAITLLQRAVEHEPDRVGVYPRLIELLQASGRSVDAERRLRDYAQRELPDDARRRRVELLMTQGLWSLAVADAEALGAGAPADMLLLARARQGGGDLVGAADAYRAMLATGDADAQSVAAAADFFGRRDGFEAGLATLERLPASLTPEQRLLQAAAYHERHGRMEEAEALFAEAVATGGSATAWAEAIRLRIRQGRIEEAKAVADDGLAAHPADPQLAALRRVVDGSGTLGLSPEEIAAIAGSVVDERTRQVYERLVAAEATLRRDRAEGVAALRSLVESAPTFLPARRVLVSVLLSDPQTGERSATLREQERAEAVQVAQAAAVAMPADPRAPQLAYEVFNLLGRREQALAAAREWRLRTPLEPYSPDVAIANLLLRDGRAQEAMTTLAPYRDRLVAEATAERPQGLELLARALAATGRADEAHALLWERAEQRPEWMQLYLRVAGVVPPPAVDEWIDRLDGALTTPDDRIGLAGVAFNAASAAPSRARFERVLAIAAPLAEDPSAGLGAMMLAGVSEEQLEDVPAAMAWYRRIVDAGHEEPVALNNLAYLMHSTGGSPDEAVELAQRAVRRAGELGRGPVEQATFHDTLAEILLAMGRAQEAEAAYRRAVDLAPQEGIYRVGLAESLAALGRMDEAQNELTRAEAMLPGGTDERLRTRLRALRDLINGRG